MLSLLSIFLLSLVFSTFGEGFVQRPTSLSEGQSDERQLDERQLDERQVDERQLNKRQLDERQLNKRQLDKRELEERQLLRDLILSAVKESRSDRESKLIIIVKTML
jgi:hypothetical protein